MNKIVKSGQAGAGAAVSTEDMEAINRFTLEPLTAEQVFVFSINACDDQVDRDLEQFSADALGKLSELFVGKTVIFDHTWSAGNQTARIFGAEVRKEGSVSRLRVKAYMLHDAQSQPVIDRINGGILREVSVACAIGRASCSICGEDYFDCGHRRGEVYGGKTCHVVLEDPQDAYELSFVAVPAQREAAVTKRKGYCPELSDAEKTKPRKQAEARLALRSRILRNI